MISIINQIHKIILLVDDLCLQSVYCHS